MEVQPAQVSHIRVSRTARVVSSAPWSERAERLWIVLHGYGERAEDFLARFQPVADRETLVVAPEGLSRFYLRTRRDEVGASWMTSRDREQEIADYLAYLDQVHGAVSESAGAAFQETVVVGFSQGAATASRWVAGSRAVSADRLILWGALPAAELRTREAQERLAPCRVDWVTGSEDRFTPPGKMHEACVAMQTESCPVHLTTFSGGHEIDPETLVRLAGLRTPRTPGPGTAQ